MRKTAIEVLRDVSVKHPYLLVYVKAFATIDEAATAWSRGTKILVVTDDGYHTRAYRLCSDEERAAFRHVNRGIPDSAFDTDPRSSGQILRDLLGFDPWAPGSPRWEPEAR